MGGHVADDMRIVTDARGAEVSRPTIGLGGGTGDEVGFKKSVQAASRVIGHFAKADTTGTAILDLDGAGDEDFALMAASAATGDRIVFAAAGDFGFIHLDETGERAAARGEHAAAQFGAEQPRGLVGAESELTLQLQRRDAVGVGGHQISGPEPGGQRQLGVMHDGSSGDRGLAAAVGALIGPGLGFQSPGFATATAWADKPIRPARRGTVLSAGCLVAKALLELENGTFIDDPAATESE